MKKNVTLILSVLFAAMLLYLLMIRTERAVLINSFQHIDWRFSATGFFLYAIVNIMRGYRFYLMLGKKMRLRDMVGITFIHNFLVNLLPFRTGELSYPYLLRRRGFAQDGESVASLIASRLFDVLLVAYLILISFVMVLIPLAIPANGKMLFWIVAAFLLIGSFVLIFFMEGLVWAIQRLFHVIRFQRFHPTHNIMGGVHFFSFLMNKIDEARRVFIFVKSRDGFFHLLFLSLLIWVGNFWVGGLLLWGVGIKISFWQVVFVFAFPIILSEISPVQSFANLGIYEWSLVGGLLLLGVSQNTAAAVSLSVHLQELLFAGIVAFLGMIILWIDILRENKETL